MSFVNNCPRCRKGDLFIGWLDLRPFCAECGLDYSKIDAGDGPAVFTIFILGIIMVIGAIWLEFAYTPPFWLHVVIWPPTIILSSFVLLRLIKVFFIYQQYSKKNW